MFGLAEISACFAAIVAVITVVKWLMDRGKQDAAVDAAQKEAEAAKSLAITAVAKADLTSQQLSEYKTLVARDYVAVSAMEKVEHRITDEMQRLSDGLGRRVDELNATLIRTLTEALAAPSSSTPKPKR